MSFNLQSSLSAIFRLYPLPFILYPLSFSLSEELHDVDHAANEL
jgi:hypothetical protein